MTESDIMHHVHLSDLEMKRKRLPSTTGPERVELEAAITRLERITRGHWTDAQIRRDRERRGYHA